MSHGVLERYDAFLIDVDGVLVRESEPIAGSAEAFSTLQRYAPVLVLTNNSTRTRAQLAEHLANLGFRVTASDIVCSASAAARWLAGQGKPVHVWPLGEDGLIQELSQAGLTIATNPESADWVVAGMNRRLTYAHLADALTALRSGARFLACNCDPTFPTPDGLLPGAGAVIGAIQGMGFVPNHIVGKPSQDLYRCAAETLGLQADRMLMIGDRLDTDILGGSRFGADTLFVESGVSCRQDIPALEIAPTWIARSLADALRGDIERWPSDLPPVLAHDRDAR